MKSNVMLALVLAGAGLAVWYITRHRETMAALAPPPLPLAGASAALPYYALPVEAPTAQGIATSAGYISPSDIALVSEAELEEFLASL